MARVTFRFTLTTAFLGILFTVVSTTATASFYFSRKNAEDLSSQILDQTSERIRLNTQGLIDTALEQSQTLTNLLESGFLDQAGVGRDPSPSDISLTSVDFRHIGGYLFEAMRVHDSLAYLSLALPQTGEYLFVVRRGSDLTIREFRLSDESEMQVFDYDSYDRDRRPIATPPYTGYDPRDRPFYQRAIDAGVPDWTDTYVFIGIGEESSTPGITLTAPIFYPGTTDLMAVTTADFELQGLCNFLANVKVGKSGFAFIMETRTDGSQWVIAHPDCALLMETVITQTNETTRQLIPADRIQDNVVTSLIATTQKQDNATPIPKIIEFQVGEQIYWGQMLSLDTVQNPPWTLGLALPRSDVMAQVEQNNRINLLLGVLGVLLTALLASFISKTISQPLQSLADETVEIGRFHLKPKTWSRSMVVEIERLMNAIEETKLSLRSFRKYVPADIVQGLMQRGEEAQLGGKCQTLTIYFCDIVNFTGIAEQMSPDQLVDHIGTYLDKMSGQIITHHGTVDKYIGDAIMAFWGAPEDNVAHAIDACRTAIANQQALTALRDQWKAQNLPALYSRIGIHTGEVIVGNIGSSVRMNYTVLGDSVNLAQRLEGINKYYDTNILISQTTFAEVKDEVVTRHIDFIAVKGRRAGIHIYELIGLKQDISAEVAAMAAVYSQALTDYHRRQWNTALAGFETYLDQYPGDKAATMLRERCQRCKQEPPGPEWSGLHRMSRK